MLAVGNFCGVEPVPTTRGRPQTFCVGNCSLAGLLRLTVASPLLSATGSSGGIDLWEV